MLPFLAPPAEVQIVPLPAYSDDDAFIFSDGRVEQVRRTKGDNVLWAGLAGSPYWRNRNPIVPILSWKTRQGEGRRTVVGNPDKLWPLGAHHRVRFRVVTESRKTVRDPWVRTAALWSCEAGDVRIVSVVAGDFEAIPIRCDRHSATTMKLVERLSWDYAPDLGHYVRRTTVNFLRATEDHVELSAAVHGTSATRGRLEALSRLARDRYEAEHRPTEVRGLALFRK